MRPVRFGLLSGKQSERLQRSRVIAASRQQRRRETVRGVFRGGPAACQRVLQSDASVACVGSKASTRWVLMGFG